MVRAFVRLRNAFSQQPSSGLMLRINAKFCGTVAIQNLSRPFLALLDFVVAQIRRQAVNSGFSETDAWIQAKFCGKLPIHHISR